MDKIKLSLKNTLWFLVPSVAIVLYGWLPAILNRYFPNWESDLYTSYYFYLLPNIPFFVASYALFSFLGKGLNRALSVFLSNVLFVGSWLLTFYLSFILIGMPSSYGFEGLMMFAVAILALIIFFVRSVFVSVHYTAPEKL